MTLTPFELNRMEELIYASKSRSLNPLEESELRNYVLTEQPNAKDAPISQLITLGLILVGLYLLAKAFEEK